ncbi:bem46 protein, variant [Elasticomyces elasticus]|nr:bem46 protein, variant [Elasticomyces elasticus]
MTAVLWSYLRIPLFATGGLAGLFSSALYYYQKYVRILAIKLGTWDRIIILTASSELIYPRYLPPNARTEVPRPPEFHITDYEELTLPTPDGESLSAFLIKPPNKQHARAVTFLMFHGNAGNIGHRLPVARMIAAEIHCNVLMLQYRGYGLSTGTPDERGLTIDAQTGLDFIRKSADLKSTKIVVYGQSLGGAVGIGLVARNQEAGDIAGLILENTFLSIKKMIPSVFWAASYLAPLCHQVWPSEKTLPQITNVSILFLSGLRDEIVPPSHMKTLYEICRSPTKMWRELPYGDHNNTVAEPGYFAFVEEFIRDHVAK